MQVALDSLPEADIRYSPAEHRWTVTLPDGAGAAQVRTLSEWRWGARKRLVAAAADGGRLDPARFSQGFGALCWEPEPPADAAMLWTWIGLSLAGLGPLCAAADAEATLAARLGLGPSAIDNERPSDLAPLLAASASGAPSPGWTVLHIDEAGA